jgi:hypothetical protein
VRDLATLHGLLKINNMYPVSGGKDKLRHLGLPPSGLVSEMHSGFQ